MIGIGAYRNEDADEVPTCHPDCEVLLGDTGDPQLWPWQGRNGVSKIGQKFAVGRLYDGCSLK